MKDKADWFSRQLQACRRARLLVLTAGLFLSSSLQAEIVTSARFGGGPGRFRGTQVNAGTSTFSGTLRLGYIFSDFGLAGGLDATTFRILKSSRTLLTSDIQGNQLGPFLAWVREPWTIWVGAGLGQIRQDEQVEEDHAKTYRFLAKEQEIGISFDVYRSLYGKIDGNLLWRRYIPESKWRERFAVAAIDAWQFELGLKLLDW